jgi:hypothetical protein
VPAFVFSFYLIGLSSVVRKDAMFLSSTPNRWMSVGALLICVMIVSVIPGALYAASFCYIRLYRYVCFFLRKPSPRPPSKFGIIGNDVGGHQGVALSHRATFCLRFQPRFFRSCCVHNW